MPEHRGPESQREMLSLVTARVRDAYVRKPFYVDGALDLVSVCRLLSAQGLTSALVRDGGRLGIFTTTDLRDALLRAESPAVLAVREVARFELVEIEADAELFEALWLMVRQRVHRLLVRDGSGVLGVLGQLDLVSFVANHSHIVAVQIDEATSVAELKAAAQRVDAMAVWLHDDGIRVERIARLVGELNRRLFARLWQLLAPPALVADSCLLVMGSEGRGEQILKTDQDNALLLRDGVSHPELADVAARFNAALIEFGYPPCPGGIMLTRPPWQASETQFKATLQAWLYGADPLGVVHLAIFFDAVAVAGDESLLRGLREYLDGMLAGGDAFLARFAAAADQFEEHQSWLARLTSRADDQLLDLKKLGTFPIVHGVRALCLKHGVREAGTAARLEVLVARRLLDAPLGRDLAEALHFLMGLRLRHQLRARAAGAVPDNTVRPSALSTMERDQLRDALAIGKRFRTLLRQVFRLDAL
ncbi:putative nucleotidyltransferase substrate binding domain-containing protein [uncultured Piscinibacter sp.]|uniref:putative nucleotidyltransferase substrate binding domain-containing protein n=1 Tax=uncultured Piscinibacter sp. TaxID=1131835 RepID=UPI0026127A30|nr:putative nucleotidyltransferase substrate binding domain-containing protein [uncultured Piscinibacter sp.]